MRVAELFRKAREAKGLKQAEIADQCGISRSALARFETGSLRLADENLLVIAPLLDINPEFLHGNTKIPFKSQSAELIKFTVNKYHVNTDILLTAILTTCDVLDVFYLSPPLTIVDRLRHLNIADNPTYALLMGDEGGNIYLFRCKSAKDFIAWDNNLSSWYSEQRKLTGKSGHFEMKTISKVLYEKIRDWNDVNKVDVEFMISQKNQDLMFKELVLSETEKKLVTYIREQHLNPEDAILKLQQ